MKIYHEEGAVVYEISELKDGYKLHDTRNNKVHSYKESYEAIWSAIELIRNSSLDLLTEEDLKMTAQKLQLNLNSIPKALLTQLKKEKISHTYYDQIFLKLLTSYRCGHPEISVSNKTNFIIQHELQFLIRKMVGSKLSIPTIPG